MQKNLIYQAYKDLESNIKPLEYSIYKYEPFNPSVVYSYEDLEFYDSLSFRYEKTVEAFFHFFKTLELYLYGELSDTVRQRLQKIEKLNLVDTGNYMEARILRNKVVHAYLPEKLEEIYSSIYRFSMMFLKDFEKIKKYCQEEIKCL